MSDKLSHFITAVLSLILVCAITVLAINIKEYKAMSSTNDKIGDNDSAIKIGLSMGTLKEDRWLRDRDVFMAKAKALGAEVIVQNANNDAQSQIEQVRYLIDQGIDVLVIVPTDRVKAAAAVEAAKKAGIKVIAYDRLVMKAKVDLYMSFDNEEVGRLMAQALVTKEPKGNYLIINGDPSDNNTSMIKKGYDKVLEPLVKAGAIRVLAEEWAEGWMSEYAFDITEKYLKKGVKIDAILTGDDMLAAGAIRALSEYKLSGNVLVAGQDADLAACQRIIEGTQYMTVYKPVDKLAETAADMAVKLAKGQSINVSDTIYDGEYEVPYYIIKPIAVNSSNLDDTVIKDGFHNYDEVYGR